MRRWSELAERVASTTRTSEKTGLLAEYLRTLDADELPIAVVFLTGRPFPEADQRATGIGWATIGNAVAQVTGSGRADLAAAYDRFSDISAAVGDVLANAGHDPDEAGSPSLVEVAATFAAIEAASGPARKAQLLADLLARSDPKTARGIVRILSGELRIGLREGLVEAALAKAFDRPLDAVKRAGMLTGDIGRTAELASTGRLDGAELALFHPLKFMLASPASGSRSASSWRRRSVSGISSIGATVPRSASGPPTMSARSPLVGEAAARFVPFEPFVAVIESAGWPSPRRSNAT